MVGYPFRSKSACFQGQRSAHAVQQRYQSCVWAVNGPTLSPGPLGSTQAFQNPTRMFQALNTPTYFSKKRSRHAPRTQTKGLSTFFGDPSTLKSRGVCTPCRGDIDRASPASPSQPALSSASAFLHRCARAGKVSLHGFS